MQPVRHEGTYRGQVVEAETGAPVADAVVLGIWHREYLTVAGGIDEYYDSREISTDANGDFVMPGMGLLLLSNLIPMEVLIFKAGYEYFGPYLWESFADALILRDMIRWEGKKAIIPLKKLTLEERKKRLIGLQVSVPDTKQKFLIRELNKEDVELGRRPGYKEPE